MCANLAEIGSHRQGVRRGRCGYRTAWHLVLLMGENATRAENLVAKRFQWGSRASLECCRDERMLVALLFCPQERPRSYRRITEMISSSVSRAVAAWGNYSRHEVGARAPRRSSSEALRGAGLERHPELREYVHSVLGERVGGMTPAFLQAPGRGVGGEFCSPAHGCGGLSRSLFENPAPQSSGASAVFLARQFPISLRCRTSLGVVVCSLCLSCDRDRGCAPLCCRECVGVVSCVALPLRFST